MNKLILRFLSSPGFYQVKVVIMTAGIYHLFTRSTVHLTLYDLINVHIRFRIVGTIESPIPELVFLTTFIACHEKQALFVRVY